MAVDNKNSETPAAEKDRAQTPLWFMQALARRFGFVPDLDVCAEGRTAKAPAYYSIDEGCNSLVLPWAPKNWCNPPFSDITPWIEKAHAEAQIGAVSYSIFPDTPETGYCRRSFELATHIYHMPFRMRFLRPDGTPFLDKRGAEASPKFACRLVVFDESTRAGDRAVVDYFDPRLYLDGVKDTRGTK